jgi:deazaflavin-dependent oxidoreductase (nitroreductase family)
MNVASEPPYLYLTTIGRRTGRQHTIEIWFVAHAGCWYVMSGEPESSDWVKNLRASPVVSWRVGSRDAPLIQGTARIVGREDDPAVAQPVEALMQAKYNWNSGLIVELRPA